MNVSPPASAETLERICQENLAVYRESAARLQEDVSQESQVAHDYRGRLVYELLQNADDALLDAHSGGDRVVFRLTDDALWVANTGRALTDEDVRGLCGLGASSKIASAGPRRASIGHKGLGFKSVLEITEAPEAYSETVCFALGRAGAEQRVHGLWSGLGRGRPRGVPAMRFPSLIGEGSAVWDDFAADGFHCAFRFPFSSTLADGQREALATQLLTLPKSSALFLKHLEEVVIEVDTLGRRGTRPWLLERHRVTEAGLQRCGGLAGSGLYRVDLVGGVGAVGGQDAVGGDRYWVAHNEDVAIGEHRDGLDGPAWEGVEVSEVSVAVRDADDPILAPADQRFHVFLPTQEPSGCSVLINGAFSTDMSRQHVQVPESETNYNRHLIRMAAGTFVQTLVPHLLDHGGARYVLQVLDRHGSAAGQASEVLYRELVDVLADRPLLPAGDAVLSLRHTVLPSPSLGPDGPTFAALLKDDSQFEGRWFPDPEFCEESLSRVCAAYGARSLTARQTLEALAHLVDPARAVLDWAPDGRFQVDPVLELCTALWEQASAPERAELVEAARKLPVFPVGQDDDGTVTRVALGGDTAFYPPRIAAERLPLLRLQFLAHAVCWGKLEQRDVLSRQLRAWTDLFDIKEYGFQEVMSAAVLPGLRSSAQNADLHKANRSFDAVAAIRRLAEGTMKPDRPLPLSRLGPDAALFDLSRLQVPCRPQDGGQPLWAPAYQVYFGRDWVGADSVEDLADAMADAGAPMDLAFLAAPQEFERSARGQGAGTPSHRGEDADPEGNDEVTAGTALEGWRSFFAWLGVSRALRLVPFHDVGDDANTEWTRTKGMELPRGRAFQGLEPLWSGYRETLVERLSSDPRWERSDPYLYQLHRMDRLHEVAPVARIAGSRVGEQLLGHLVRNWAIYDRHLEAQVALVAAGKSHSLRRRSPPRATVEEVVTAGGDFWLYQLRGQAFCPTSHGPRRPAQSWRRSHELERRLGGRSRAADTFLPVLQHPSDAATAQLRACLDALEVRGELTPAAFGLDDARDMCERLEVVYGTGLDERTLRGDVRPLYRQMFELLVGSESRSDGLLADAPLAARTAAGIRFLPARDVVYASTPGSRERSGIQGKVPLFVLEAEPGALRPLREYFTTPVLEEALDWSPQPGEPALDGDALRRFRAGLRELLPALLARLAAERPTASRDDAAGLLRFVKQVEPVDSLVLRCAFRGQDLGAVPRRAFFVRRRPETAFQAFILWTGPAWPPIPEDEQTLAMALAETLGVNMVETFLSFIRATHDQRRELLALAGASEGLADAENLLAEPAPPEGPAAHEGIATAAHHTLVLTDGQASVAAAGVPHRHPPGVQPAAHRIPLHRFEDLLIDGEVVRLEGAAAARGLGPDPGGEGPGSAVTAGSGPRAAAGTDLAALDRLGMQITIAFERRRLAQRSVAVLPGDAPPSGAEALIVDVSGPNAVQAAAEQSTVVRAVLDRLRGQGISEVYPGFDILTIIHGDVDRMIELKSSGVDAQVQAMSWNEWKSARGPLRELFWLYLVGNLRSDLHDSTPFLRAVHNPFGALAATESEEVVKKRIVQLRVREFAAADQLTLEVRRGGEGQPQ